MFNIIKKADKNFLQLSDLQKIEYSVDLLIKKDFATKGLFQKIKKSLDKFGPYWVFDNGVAVAHAAPSPDCLKVGVSMITSTKGFDLFGKKINLLFTLCVPEDGDHIALLQKVILAVSDEKEKAKLLKTKDL